MYDWTNWLQLNPLALATDSAHVPMSAQAFRAHFRSHATVYFFEEPSTNHLQCTHSHSKVLTWPSVLLKCTQMIEILGVSAHFQMYFLPVLASEAWISTHCSSCECWLPIAALFAPAHEVLPLLQLKRPLFGQEVHMRGFRKSCPPLRAQMQHWHRSVAPRAACALRMRAIAKVSAHWLAQSLAASVRWLALRSKLNAGAAARNWALPEVPGFMFLRAC